MPAGVQLVCETKPTATVTATESAIY